MARIRSIKPEFWTSEQVMDLSPNARLMFIGLWNFCDDAGIHPASTKRLKAEICPADDVRSEDVRRMIDECINVGLLSEYEVDGEAFWIVTGWHHQKIDQPSFKYPHPDGSVPDGPAKRRQSNKNQAKNDQSAKVFAERSPPEGRGEEGKGRERKELTPTPKTSSESLPLELTSDEGATGQPDPLQPILDAYHQLLPKCERIAVLNPKRRKRLLAAIKLAKSVCKSQQWPYDAGGFWAAYFGECATDPWMRGEVPNPKNLRWRQNLDVLLAEDRFASVMDRAIGSMREAA